GYLGRDIFGFTSPNGFNSNFTWGNTLGVLRWQHVFSPRLTMNTAASVTSYKYTLSNAIDQFSFELGSNILDFTERTDFDYVPNDRHTIKFGAAITEHKFGVGRLQRSSQDNSVN